MAQRKKYLILFFISLCSVFIVQAQNIKNGHIEAVFLKDKVEVIPGKTVFNILNIKNNSDKEITLNVTYNTPKDWRVIGPRMETVTIQPDDKVSLPVRVAISFDAQGGIGYAIVANMTDIEGQLINTQYCFINIPIKSKINLKLDRKNRYFNHKDLSSSFSFDLTNLGNIDEMVNLTIIPDKTLKLEDSEDKTFVDNIEIKRGRSKTVSYDISLKKDFDYKKYRVHKASLSFRTNDSIFTRNIWFNYLDWEFHNIEPELESPLTIDFTALNLFGELEPVYRISVYGKILFKKQRNIKYLFENINRNPSVEDIYLNSRAYIQYNSIKTRITLGDILENFEIKMNGRGVAFLQNIGSKNILRGTANRNLISPISTYAMAFRHNFIKPFSLELGGGYSDDDYLQEQNWLGFTNISSKFNKNNTLNLTLGYSQRYSFDNSPVNSGYGTKFYLNGFLKNKLRYNIRGNYGTPYYQGYSSGKFNLMSLGVLPFSGNRFLNFRYLNQIIRPGYISDGVYYSDKYNAVQKASVIYLTNLLNLRAFAGIGTNIFNTNSYILFTDDAYFSSITPNIQLGIKFRERITENAVSIKTQFGLTNITNYSNEIYGQPVILDATNTVYPVAEFLVSLNQKYLNINFLYHHGPKNISQQLAYFYSSFFSKIFNTMVTYQRSFFNDKMEFILRGSYINNLASKTNRLNFNTGLEWNVGKGWHLRFFNTSSYQKAINSNSISNAYTSTYFEVGIRKSFHFNQPRIKYHDFTAVYYKDLNGNRNYEANEPGVESIFSDIQRADPIADMENPDYNNEFLRVDLLSNQEGKIHYINMAEGDYRIKYSQQETFTDNFESESTEKTFSLNRDTVVYIPFIERNKLFGRVNLNRTKHSALGDIPIDNIKIMVEGDNKTYSTLTDKDGYFEMYIPVADYYKVKVNNIFSEHFSLRQEYFIVKFNGYKSFEVSFDFDENERTIAFDESDFLVDDDDVPDDDFSFDDIKIIKQTNLKGVVRDANSLLPIHSTVSIYNSNTNQLISETASSNRTGVYFTSFFAGDSYYIKVSAKGYWVVKENLNIQQVTTFENLTKDILLNKINIDDEIQMDNLYFNSESAQLTPLAKAELDDMISTLYLNPSIIIEISGHADNIEALLTDPKKLSESRARNVAAYLVSNGLKENRIKIIAKSNTDPKSKEDSEEGRARNRRVDIKVAGF